MFGFSMKTHCFIMYETTALPPKAATCALTIANTSAIKAWRKPLTPPSYNGEKEKEKVFYVRYCNKMLNTLLTFLSTQYFSKSEIASCTECETHSLFNLSQIKHRLIELTAWLKESQLGYPFVIDILCSKCSTYTLFFSDIPTPLQEHAIFNWHLSNELFFHQTEYCHFLFFFV